MVCHRPFCGITSLAPFAVAAVAMLTPPSMQSARAQAAQAAQHATLSDNTKSDGAKSESAKPPASQTTGAGTVAAVGQANPAQQKSPTSKALEKAKEVGESAGHIFIRGPALPPK